MKLEVTSSFMESVMTLDKKSIRSTLSSINDMQNSQISTSLSIHKIDRCKCDDSFRSARVSDDIRIIFSIRGDVSTLLYVDHHDAAYDWCEGKYFGKTSFGAEMIYDVKALQAAENFIPDTVYYSADEPSLLEAQGIKTKQLQKIDIPEIHAENLMKIHDEDQFLDYIQIFPQEIMEALLSIETGEKTFDEVYLELQDEEFERGEKAEHKDTQRRFHMLQDLNELENILNSNDFEKWTIFLHPEQERLVHKHFNGPALIEGGPGTGKTIVGIHRAAWLAQNMFGPGQGGKIMICTFSKKLGIFIDQKLTLLLNQTNQSKDRISTRSVDSYITARYKTLTGNWPQIAEIDNEINELYYRIRPAGSLAFYQFEYKEIIDPNHIQTLDEYLACDRSGCGRLALNVKQRTTAWEFFESLNKLKQQKHIMTYNDVAYAVLEAIRDGRLDQPYDAVIIDEAQDLEAVKIRVLAESTRSKTDNVFILSDANQRIFKLNSWSKDTGLNIRGRSSYLTVNYRTTKQINDYARNQFASADVMGVHMRDYKSIVNGELPEIRGFQSEIQQQKYIIDLIQKKLEYCPAEQICVICPSVNDERNILAHLNELQIKGTILKNDMLPEEENGISICTTKGVKGLEFRIVIMYNYNKIDNVELRPGMSEEIRDNYRKMIECEKYVAATRARDELYITYTEDEEEDDE